MVDRWMERRKGHILNHEEWIGEISECSMKQAANTHTGSTRMQVTQNIEGAGGGATVALGVNTGTRQDGGEGGEQAAVVAAAVVVSLEVDGIEGAGEEGEREAGIEGRLIIEGVVQKVAVEIIP